LKRVALFAASGIVAAGLSLAIGGAPALAGAGLGVAMGAVMCGVSAVLMGLARRSRRKNALLGAILGSILLSFALMAVFLVVVAAHRPDLLVPAALSALGVYVTFRHAEALEASRIESTRGKDLPGNPAAGSGVLGRSLP
jgi:hypothetical protein